MPRAVTSVNQPNFAPAFSQAAITFGSMASSLPFSGWGAAAAQVMGHRPQRPAQLAGGFFLAFATYVTGDHGQAVAVGQTFQFLGEDTPYLAVLDACEIIPLARKSRRIHVGLEPPLIGS